MQKKYFTDEERLEAKRAAGRRWAREHREERAELQRGLDSRYRRNLRADTIAAYGSQCACCGEAHSEFLAIDHINGGGASHRSSVCSGNGVKFYAWLKRQGWPKDEFRLLCANCNSARGSFGFCPHEIDR